MTFSAGASTGCSVSGSTVSVTNASGTCSLTATKAADGTYQAATSAPFTVTLNKANQAPLTIGGPSKSHLQHGGYRHKRRWQRHRSSEFQCRRLDRLLGEREPP